MPPGPPSVCPQSWMKFTCGSAVTICSTALAGMGAAPNSPVRQWDKSRSARPGTRSRNWYIVGTPKNMVIRSDSSVSRTVAGSKRGRITWQAPIMVPGTSMTLSSAAW